MILNLAKPENSEIKFEPYKFPDGQQQIKIVSDVSQYGNVDITIKSRLNNFLDLELIVCAVKSIRGLFFGTKGIRLEVPYFLGSRSDRKFEDGSNNYLKDVICPIINSLNLEAVEVLDAHSDVLEACLNNYNGLNNHSLIEFALNDIKSTGFVLMSPDAGALKKIYKVAEHIKYEGEVITCAKSRGIDGKITKTEVPHFDITKDVVLIDDICDGGRTFIEIAKIIKLRHEQYERERDEKQNERGKLYLVVTHGIFSKGFDELHNYFDCIYCTNSYKNLEPHYDLAGGGLLITRNFVKQLKVI